MGRYTSEFVTSEEFEEIKNILSSKFKLERNKVSDTNIIESYNIIVSDGKFLINYFQNKRLIIEGNEQHPQFDQVYLSVDNFLGSNRKPIIKDSRENQEEDRHKQTMSLNKKILIVAIIGVIAATTIGIIAIIPIYFNTDSSTAQPIVNDTVIQSESDTGKPNISLQIIPHTDEITTQTYPAIIFGNGTVIYKEGTVTPGPLVLYEGFVAKFTIHAYNEGPGLAKLERYVLKVLPDNPKEQPVIVSGNFKDVILIPGSNPHEIPVEFDVTPRLMPSGEISFELIHSDGTVKSKPFEYEYFKVNPFENLKEN